MYEKIQAKECIGQPWVGKKKHLMSPNITNSISFTNQASPYEPLPSISPKITSLSFAN